MPLDKPHVVTIVHSSLHKDIATMHSPNVILDPLYPAMEPSPLDHHNTLFGRRFGVLVTTYNSYDARYISNFEQLRCYSIPKDCIMDNIDTVCYATWLDDNLPFSIPVQMKHSITSNLILRANFAYDDIYNDSETADNFQCYHTTASPANTD